MFLRQWLYRLRGFSVVIVPVCQNVLIWFYLGLLFPKFLGEGGGNIAWFATPDDARHTVLDYFYVILSDFLDCFHHHVGDRQAVGSQKVTNVLINN